MFEMQKETKQKSMKKESDREVDEATRSAPVQASH
jgi:hypothetical protein